jgi:hypothetical protein
LLLEQQLVLQVDEAVVARLARQGYEPEYGARPLRRLLRRSLGAAFAGRVRPSAILVRSRSTSARVMSATLEGIEVANMIRKGQLMPGLCPFAQFAALAA